MKTRYFLTLLVFLTTNIMAQQKELTLEAAIPGGTDYRYAANAYTQWWGDKCVRLERSEARMVDPATGDEEVLLTLDGLNGMLKANGLEGLSHLYTLRFPYPDKTQVLVKLPHDFVVLDWQAGTVADRKQMDEKAAHADYSAEGGHLAYTVDNNLYVDGRQVTHEPEGVVCGQSVHRNEWGINKGTFWSPKGNLLAFYRMDESMVEEYPLVDIEAREAKEVPVRYPMAGMTSHKVTVGVYNPATGTTVFLKAGDPTDRYFTNIAWAPDEKSIYLIELNRDQNHAQLVCYDALTGDRKGVLYEERNAKYVEPQNPIVFLPWDDKQFILWSQRDSYRHLYLYNVNGKLVKALTKGNWLVNELVGFNRQRKEVYITATEVSPLQCNIYRVEVKSGKLTRLDNGLGVHNASLSPSGTYLVDRFSTPTEPRTVNLLDTQQPQKVQCLLQAKDPLRGYRLPKSEVGTIKAADGVTDLYYRITKPADLDPAKKYPVIIYVYGGPHAQMVTNGFRYDARGWDLYMANKGYIVFTLDNRGSDNRGFAFESATFRHLGVEECKDQMKGVEFLKSLPYVDAERIGVHGWSFGGHMTTGLMLRYPEVFKAGVAGGPVIDWQYYEVMYGERYMDTPQDNPEGYKETDLRNLAGNLKGRLLVIFGYQDATCVPQHSLSFMKACIDARTYPDLFIYPGHEHNMRGRDRVHLHEKITRYFEDYLK